MQVNPHPPLPTARDLGCVVERLRHAKQGVTPKRRQSWRGVAHLPSINRGCYFGLGVPRPQLPMLCGGKYSLNTGVTMNRSHLAGSLCPYEPSTKNKEGRRVEATGVCLNVYHPHPLAVNHRTPTIRHGVRSTSRVHLLRHCETHRESDTRLVQSSRMFSVSFLHIVCPALFSVSHERPPPWKTPRPVIFTIIC